MPSSPTPSTSSTPKKLRKRKIVEKMSDETPKKTRFDRTKNEKYKQLVKKSIKRLATQDQQQQQRQPVVHQEPPPPRPPTRRGQVEIDIDRRSPDLRVDKPLRQKNLNERKR
ncbi:unnamed protein product [Caenorhabditis angaria]|uniref:Uncharacterized protein n=1 Tax=Caenorhabditis angaria TaxID=860376 RepID=A0A9P1J2N1_9PELO|nr:unnamed protein product [Caenorhabditis angaria]